MILSISEVEEVLYGTRQFYRTKKGDVKGEDVYLALGTTSAQRYLAVFFIYKKTKEALIISARDMAPKERKRYERK